MTMQSEAVTAAAPQRSTVVFIRRSLLPRRAPDGDLVATVLGVWGVDNPF
jgi:hypothetical protein